MDDTALDQIITDKTNEVAAAEKPVAPAKTTETDRTPPAPKADETPAEENEPAAAEGEESPEARTPWPKTAVNAMARKERKLNQLRAKLSERETKLSDVAFLEHRLAELKGGNKPAGNTPQADPTDPEPDITKYNDWDKYQSDLRAWDKRQVMREVKGTLTETQKTEQADARIEALANTQRAKADEVISKNPEFIEIVQQNADVIDDFPVHIQHALLNAENATLAVVVLANEGTLEDLGEMSPALAEKTIKAAHARGMALIAKDEGSEGAEPAVQAQPTAQPEKKVSSAPAPIKSAKAATQSGPKRPKDMNDSEFRKEFAV